MSCANVASGRPDAFDRVIIETTGLADPAPVAQTFFIDEEIAAYYALDAIVTVVDAKHAGQQLDDFHEAQEQVGFADRILLSKSDLVSEADRDRLSARLRHINPRAPVRPVNFGETPIADLLDIGGFSLDSILEIEPGFLSEDHHEHDDEVQSFVFTTTAPFDQERLQAFFRDLIADHAPNLLRYKGVVAFDGLDQQVVFQGVHMMMGSDVGRDWRPGVARESKLVFIGRRLPRDEIFGTTGSLHYLSSEFKAAGIEGPSARPGIDHCEVGWRCYVLLSPTPPVKATPFSSPPTV